MINDIARKSIHVDSANNIPVASVKEYDNFILKLKLMKYNTPFDCTGQTVTLGVKAPSGLFEQTTDITINKDQIDIKLKTGIVSKSGICEMELKLVDSTGSMTTASFFIAVNRKILNDEAVEASDEFDSLTEAKKMEPIRQENEKGRVEAEKLRVQAETDRAAAEEIREQQELARQTCYKEIEESRKDFDGGIHKNLKLRLMRDFGDIYKRFNKANLLPYEAEYISASNSYKGMTTDNVIKGRTLQNLWDNKSIFNTRPDTEGFITGIANGNYIDLSTKNVLMFKPSTLYTIITIVEDNTLNGKFNPFIGHLTAISNDVLDNIEPSRKGVFIGTITTVSDLTDKISGIRSFIVNDCTEGSIKYKIIALEGDYTNKPIPPYFEGIKSVNEDGENLEEVSCGKNLFDYSKYTLLGGATLNDLVNGFIVEGSNGGSFVRIPIRVKKNTDYIFSFSHELLANAARKFVSIFKSNGVIFKYNIDTPISFNTGSEEELFFCFYAEGTSSARASVKYLDIQLEEGTVSTSYESYTEDRLPIKMKNLRSLPNGTCDTSDGVRRIGKVVLNGSENWGGIDVGSINTIRINSTNFLECIAIPNNTNIINDKLPSKYIYASDEEGIFISRVIGTKGNIYIRVLKNKLATQDIAGFKAWLQANPITLYYELETPTKEEGNVEQLRTYDGTTNIFTEGSLIEPTISCKVPSNVQQVVMNLRSENEALNNDVNTLQATTEENNLMNIETNVNQEARLTMLELGVI